MVLCLIGWLSYEAYTAIDKKRRQKLEERKRKKAIEAGQVASDSKGNLADSPAYEATARLLEPKEAPPAYHQVVKQG